MLSSVLGSLFVSEHNYAITSQLMIGGRVEHGPRKKPLDFGGNLSLHFNGHFPGEPGLASLYWSKGWWRWWWQLDCWIYKSCKAPVKSSPPTNQHPVFFYKLDALPVAQPTVSKHWREKYHIPWTCLPQTHLGSSNFDSDHSVVIWIMKLVLQLRGATAILYNNTILWYLRRCQRYALYCVPL